MPWASPHAAGTHGPRYAPITAPVPCLGSLGRGSRPHPRRRKSEIRRPRARGGRVPDPYRLDQGTGLRRRLDLIVPSEALDGLVVGSHGASAVAEAMEKGDEVSEPGLVARCQGQRVAAPVGRVARPVICGRLLRQGPGRLCRPVPKPRALGLQPALPLRGPGKEEANEEVSTVDLERVPKGSRGQRSLELRHVALEGRSVDADLLVPTAQDHPVAQRAPQLIDGLVERSPRVLLVQVGPQQANQGVTPVKPARRGGRQIGQKGHPLRLCEDGAELPSIRRPQLQGPEEVESDHGRFPIRRHGALTHKVRAA